MITIRVLTLGLLKTVKWDYGGNYMYNWGEELGYDVELVNLFLGSSM